MSNKINSELNIIDTVIMYLFIIALILQSFSVVQIGESGIPLIVVACIIIYIKYNMVKTINLKFIQFSMMILIKIIGDILIVGTPINSIIRLSIVLFISYTSYMYIKNIFLSNKQEIFFKRFINVVIINGIYGIYCIIGCRFYLPWFMNYFRNNPSYGINTNPFFYTENSWIEGARIATTFSEPAFYAAFLSLCFVILYHMKLSKKRKVIYNLILVINFCGTYSRVGYVSIAYILGIYILYMILSYIINYKVLYKFIKYFIIVLPFLTPIFMKLANEHVFNDLSSKTRSESAYFYMMKSFENLKSIFWGHGYKSMQMNFTSNIYTSNYVDLFAHNGIVEFTYELGVLAFIIIMIYIITLISKINNFPMRVNVLTVIVSINCFGTYYNIEAIIALISILVSAAIYCKGKYINKIQVDSSIS